MASKFGGVPVEQPASRPASRFGGIPAETPQPTPEQAQEMQMRQDDIQEMSFTDKLGDFFTGSARETAQTESLPELQASGLLAGESLLKGAAVAPALVTATDPNEIVSILTNNFPNIGVTYNKDAQGNVYPILVNNETGAATAINRPGFSAADAVNLLGLTAAYTPSGRAAGFLGAVGRSAATGAVLEAAQAISGGEFDPLTPIIDAAFGGAGQKIANAIKTFRSSKEPVTRAARQVDQEVKDAIRSARPELDDAQMDEIVDALIKGDRNKLATLAKPDPEVVAAREALELQEPGLLSGVATSPELIAKEQALKSVTPEMKIIEELSVRELQQKADDLIVQFGGGLEKAGLSEDLVKSAKQTIDDLAFQANQAYDDIGNAIPRGSKVDPSGIKAVIDDELMALGGREELLSPLEKRISGLIKGDVTYHALDKLRKQVGAALGGESEMFKNATRADLSRYYKVITEAQEKAFPELAGDWQAAKNLVSQRKQLEDQAISAFGKNLSDAFMPKIGESMRKLSKGDFKRFDELIKSVPVERRQEVVTSALNDVFTMASRKEKQLSIPGFADWYNSINRDPALKSRVWRYLDPEMRTQLDNMGTVTNAMRRAMEKEIKTGAVLGQPGVAQKIMNGASKMLLMKYIPFLSGAVEYGMEKAKGKQLDNAIKAFTDPVFVSNVSKLATAQAEQAERKIMRSKAFKDFLSTAGEDVANTISRVGLRNYMLSLDDEVTAEEAPKPNQ